MRDRNTIVQPKLSTLARDTFGYIKREIMKCMKISEEI